MKADEVEALQAQCYALAQSDQFAPLLDLVSSTTLLPKDQVVFQKAYCMYRLSRHQEALKLIASVQNPSVHLKHLEAQAVCSLYRNHLLIHLIYTITMDLSYFNT